MVIVLLVEALEIELVKIHPGREVLEHLRSTVTVGNESSCQADRLRFLEDRPRPLGGDQWLVVGADEDSGALCQCLLYQHIRLYTCWWDYGVRVANRLRSNPILAIGTVKVAAKHAEAVGESPTIGMEERFFLNGITLYAAYIPPRYVERTPAIETDFADSHLPVGNGTAVSARVA